MLLSPNMQILYIIRFTIFKSDILDPQLQNFIQHDPCVIPCEINKNVSWWLKKLHKTLRPVPLIGPSSNVSGVCSGPRAIFHPSSVEICSVIFVQSCWQTKRIHQPANKRTDVSHQTSLNCILFNDGPKGPDSVLCYKKPASLPFSPSRPFFLFPPSSCSSSPSWSSAASPTRATSTAPTK